MRTIGELMALSGRKALITGGAGHIGEAVGQTLVELGAMVGILDLSPSACAQRAKELSRGSTRRAFPVPCDLSNEEATRGAVRKTVRMMRGLDILVHCAGYTGESRMEGWAAPFSGQTAKAFQGAIQVNLISAFVLAQEAHEALSASKRGSIILMSSIYSLIGPDRSLYAGTKLANPMAYGASKGGLLQLTRYLARELAPSVRVNAISPGGIYRGHAEMFRRRYASRTPLARMAAEEDLKGAVAYLASDLSAYVTGHNLVVDGGWTV